MEKQKLWAALAAILGIAFAFTLFFANSRLTDLNIAKEKNDAAISEAKAELKELGTPAGPGTVEAADTDDNGTDKAPEGADAAKLLELGKTVADCQNKYLALDASTDKDAFGKNVDDMDGCLASTDKGARVPWYSGSEKGTWTFVPDGDGGLWLCQGDGGTLLAYGHAKFGGMSFSDVRYGMSIHGAASVRAEEGQALDDTVTGIEDMAGMMQQAPSDTQPETPADDKPKDDKPGENAPDGDEMDIKEAQWRMRQEMMEGGAGNDD